MTSEYPIMTTGEYENSPWKKEEGLKECSISCSFSKSVILDKDSCFSDKYYTIPELLKILKNLCTEKALIYPQFKNKYELIIDSCKNWIEDEYEEIYEDFESYI